MIMKYSLEETLDAGVKTDKFVLKRSHAKEAAREVIGTHMNLHGKEAEDYLDKNFEAAFEHFDTANEGKLDA